MSETVEPAGTSEEILSFWFGAPAEDEVVAQRQASLWWSKNAELDAFLRERFEPVLQGLDAEPPEASPTTPRERLARVILLDQFPRNMYRGTPQAFAWDGLTRRQAEMALAAGDELLLRPIERVFLYMPFEHAEDPASQELAVARFESLAAQASPAALAVFRGFLDFALRHRDIIRRFGRFPHRNALLGRPSTAEEELFLLEPGSSF